jgi:hypothetical protein
VTTIDLKREVCYNESIKQQRDVIFPWATTLDVVNPKQNIAIENHMGRF